MKKTIIYILVLAIIIGLGIAVGLNIEDDNKSVPTTSGKVDNNKENKVENKAENTVGNNAENNKIENVIEDETQEEGTADKAGEPKTDLEIAIDIAKKEWGTDDGVKFSLEEKTKNGEYIICVREISTTKALAWYKVNIEDETCEEW